MLHHHPCAAPHVYESPTQLSLMAKRGLSWTSTTKPHGNVLLASGDMDTPGSYWEAIASLNTGAWRTTMHKEHDSILCNWTNCLELLPASHKAICTQWLFKVKLCADGAVERCKVSWVTKGYSQQYSIDYDITYALVVQLENLRLLLVLVAALDLEVHQMDMGSAFLHTELTEEIYVTQHKGFESPEHPSHVC